MVFMSDCIYCLGPYDLMDRDDTGVSLVVDYGDHVSQGHPVNIGCQTLGHTVMVQLSSTI